MDKAFAASRGAGCCSCRLFGKHVRFSAGDKSVDVNIWSANEINAGEKLDIRPMQEMILRAQVRESEKHILRTKKLCEGVSDAAAPPH